MDVEGMERLPPEDRVADKGCRDVDDRGRRQGHDRRGYGLEPLALSAAQGVDHGDDEHDERGAQSRSGQHRETFDLRDRIRRDKCERRSRHRGPGEDEKSSDPSEPEGGSGVADEDPAAVQDLEVRGPGLHQLKSPDEHEQGNNELH
jgi:hypothetical protein